MNKPRQQRQYKGLNRPSMTLRAGGQYLQPAGRLWDYVPRPPARFAIILLGLFSLFGAAASVAVLCNQGP